MLIVSQRSGFNAARPRGPASISYRTNDVDTVNATIYTFTSQDIGTAAGNRHVIVSVFGNAGSAGDVEVNSITIGGILASRAARNILNSGGFVYPTEIWIAPVTTGATGDIVVTWSMTRSSCSIGVWAAYDLQDTAPTATAGYASEASDPADVSLTTTSGGVVVGFGMHTFGTTVWTGLTERFDAVAVDSARRQTGADATITTGSALTIVADASGGSGHIFNCITAAFR